MKMDSWTFFVVFSLCFSTHLQTGLATEVFKKFASTQLDDLVEDTGSNDTNQKWDYSNGRTALATHVESGGVSWFVTKSLNLGDTSYLEIEASCRKDEINCKNPFQLEVYGTNQSSATPFEKYEFIQNVIFEKRSVNNATIEKSYPRLYILVRTSKASSFYIHSISIRYYFCEETTIDNTYLRKVYSLTTNVEIHVRCPDNAVASDGNSTNTTVQCTPKGNWTQFEKCECNKGFHSGTGPDKRCSNCPHDYYKNTIGDKGCLKCPDGKTNTTEQTGCKCKKDRYAGDNENGPCYAVPPKVENVKINATSEPKQINVTWEEAMNEDGFNKSITYTVEVYLCTNQSSIYLCNTTPKDVQFSPRKKNLTKTYVIVSNVVLKQEYKIKVISMSSLKNVSNDTWKFSEKNYTYEGPLPAPSEESKSEKNENIIIYVAAAVVAVVVIVLLIALIIIIRKRRRKSKKHGEDNHGFTNVPLGQRTYVDPSEYDNPEEALRDFTNEISERNLTLERVLGRGEFGEVYKGTLKTGDGGVIKVAVKTLKHDADARSRRDFFLEGSAMGQFNDPNVIHLEGVVTKTIPNMIVIEYMANGSLDNVLKQNDGQFTDLQLVGMARGVASGMKYLAAMNFVHRDLAARNILVNETLLCKVADFGLSRVLETADSSRGEYRALGGKIPVRWTAPEAIKYRKFSTASDVWSYGILLWEIMSFAERPYWDWNNFKLVERIDEGYRLPAPKNCPKAVHELMLLCWESSREKRPEFTAIVGMFDDWIRSPETIRYTNLPKRPVSGGGVHDPAMLVEEWLLDIKMDSYIHIFTEAGLTQISDLAGLEDSDLQSIGVSLIGHRNKMLRTIRSLPITDETKKTPWNRAPSVKV